MFSVMSESTAVYRVKYADGDWVVIDRQGMRVGERIMTQAMAVVHAKELAWAHGSAQIIVHDEHGQVASEFIYQREERPALSADDLEPSLAATKPAHKGLRATTKKR